MQLYSIFNQCHNQMEDAEDTYEEGDVNEEYVACRLLLLLNALLNAQGYYRAHSY